MATIQSDAKNKMEAINRKHHGKPSKSSWIGVAESEILGVQKDYQAHYGHDESI
jgi:hypothetical protein